MQQNFEALRQQTKHSIQTGCGPRDVVFIRGAGQARTRDQRITKRPRAAVSFGVAASTFLCMPGSPPSSIPSTNTRNVARGCPRERKINPVCGKQTESNATQRSDHGYK
jgi:hypothetical protein